MFSAQREAPAGSRDNLPPLKAAAANGLTTPIDTERLVWDQEYRDEIRTRLKTGSGKA